MPILVAETGRVLEPKGSAIETRNGANGANDGARTRDNQNHNLGLYQLSYVRRCRGVIIAFSSKGCQKLPVLAFLKQFRTQKPPNPLGLS